MNEELKVIISAEVSKFQQNVEKAKKQIQGFKEQVKKASEDVDKNFANLGAGVAKGAKWAAAGIAAGATALLALGASTQEYRNQQAQLITSFEAAGASAEVARSTYEGLQRVLGDSGQAQEAAQHLAKLTTEEEALSEWTNICQGVYATFGASLPIEGLTEAVNHTAQLGEVQGPLADALEWSGITADDFNEKLAECTSIEEREKLIRETLTGLYDEAAATYEKNNKAVLEQNEAQERLSQTTAALGEAVAPVVSAFTQFASDALAKVVPYIQELADQYLPSLTELLSGLVDSLASAFEWVVQHKTLLSVMAGIITGVVTAIGLYNAVAVVKAAMAAAEVTSVWALVAAYAAQAVAMAAALAPYLLIVAAIAAVIAIIVVCVKYWDEIVAAVKIAWEFIKDITKKAVDFVVKWFKEMVSKIKVHIQNILSNVQTIFSNIKETIVAYITMAKTIVLSIFDGIKNGIQNRIETVKNVIQNIVKLIKAIFTGDFGAAKEAVLGIFDSIKNGIKNSLENAKTTVKNVIDAIRNFFNFTWSLPKLKMPKITITGKFSLSPLQVPKFSITWNKLGGIFDKPTLFNYGGSLQGIGENGAEAVVPLEKNLGWLNKLADMLNERMGGNSPVVLTVDGKVFAQTAINTINQQTRQTGKLALNLV